MTDIITGGVTLSTEATEQMMQMMQNYKFLQPKDIVDAVVYLLSTPPNVLITEFTIRPMNEVF
jgi:NADP-dependent 3-hydroxy acid dehydrogenase YdfG